MSPSLTQTRKALFKKVRDVVLETVWPTRCAVCDVPGDDVLCSACKQALLFIDIQTACPCCGAPYGRIQCTECNDVMLSLSGLKRVPFAHMTHAVVLDEAARRIVSVYKDAGERRLVDAIARIMTRYIEPELIRREFTATYIPDTKAAFLRRGFDHGEELAHTLAQYAGLSCVGLFQRPHSSDQRELGRVERIDNMRAQLHVKSDAVVPQRVLVIDDVCTTGATVYRACMALTAAGAKEVHVLTFAQVMD